MLQELTRAIQPAPPEFGGKSPCHLSQEQIRFFDENGYLILRHWITGPLLERLQNAGRSWIDQGQKAPENMKDDSSDKGYADFQFAERAKGRVMYRVNYLHNKGEAASLELLGDPRVLAVAESLCGRNFVPTYESMVFKQEGDGEKVRWHQDAIHPHRRWRIFNFDLYLDSSTMKGGALRVLPGTHFQEADVCKLVGTEQWEGPHIQVVEMEPGDVLLHDVMIVHGSPAVLGQGLRRTIYYEFRAAEEILEDGPWDKAWIERRMRLIPVALKKYGQAFPEESAFVWNVGESFKPAPLGDEQAELKVAHEVHMRPGFCSAGDAGKPVK
jgi:ectoine hydroxylase-related dioxygenase (phytanoyl-CoA dioxygenase family)